MTNSTAVKYRLLILLPLVIVIAVGSAVVWSRGSRGQSIEISTAPGPELKGEVYVGGAVNNPGAYPLRSGDTVEDILRFAGGVTANAESGRINLNVPQAGDLKESQKVNINRAEEWLLEALPGVGKTLAQRIVDYRRQNGPFKSTGDLLKVEGFGTASYQRIEPLITVTD